MDKRRLLLIVAFSFATAYLLHLASKQLRHHVTIDGRSTAPAITVSAASRSLRPNYPYSVIPGGAYSPAELRSAIEHDPLIDGHYAGFNLKSVRLVALTDDRLQYVSYRLKGRIYWTHNMLRIPKGEVLLTDGSSFARTRCGNRLSSQPKAQTAANQPSEHLLSLPPFTPALLAKGEITLAPPVVDGQLPGGVDLPVTLPLLAPYLPPSTGLPVAEQIWPSSPSPSGPGLVAAGPPAFSAPGGPGYLPGTPGSPTGTVPIPVSPPITTPVVPDTPGTPGVTRVLVPVLPVLPGSPGAPSGLPPILPIVPIAPGTPVPIATVPEPADLTLFAASFCGWLWLLTRVLRLNSSPQNEIATSPQP